MKPDDKGGEPCDGKDLGGATCASLGYAGGALGCDPSCAFDTSRCKACVPSPHVDRCARADVDVATGVRMLAIATDGAELAAAWVSGPASAPRGALHFALFHPVLEKIMESGCAGPTALGAADMPSRLALAARPGGWILALEHLNGTSLRWLDERGAVRRRALLQGRSVELVACSGGEPLVLYEPGSPYIGTAGVVLDGAGKVVSGPVWVASGNDLRGVWTGDGYLVAARDPAASNPISVTRLDANLRVLGRRMVAATSREGIGIAWSGSEAWIVHGPFSRPEYAVVRVSREGAPLGPPRALALAPDGDPARLVSEARAEPVPIDAESFALPHLARARGGAGMQLHHAIFRIDGKPLVPSTRISAIPSAEEPEDLLELGVAQIGKAAFVAWSAPRSPGRLDLASIIP